MSSHSDTPQIPVGDWTCQFCGYVYNEAEGDPDNGVPAGTRWEDIPADWCCPLCSADKADFTQG